MCTWQTIVHSRASLYQHHRCFCFSLFLCRLFSSPICSYAICKFERNSCLRETCSLVSVSLSRFYVSTFARRSRGGVSAIRATLRVINYFIIARRKVFSFAQIKSLLHHRYPRTHLNHLFDYDLLCYQICASSSQRNANLWLLQRSSDNFQAKGCKLISDARAKLWCPVHVLEIVTRRVLQVRNFAFSNRQTNFSTRDRSVELLGEFAATGLRNVQEQRGIHKSRILNSRYLQIQEQVWSISCGQDFDRRYSSIILVAERFLSRESYDLKSNATEMERIYVTPRYLPSFCTSFCQISYSVAT